LEDTFASTSSVVARRGIVFAAASAPTAGVKNTEADSATAFGGGSSWCKAAEMTVPSGSCSRMGDISVT
jgi:hypothetical protein